MITLPNPSHPSPADETAPDFHGKKFVWLLSPPWNGVWTRQNHFALRLARLGAEILYVENPPAWSSSVKQRSWNDLPLGSNDTTREVLPGIHVMRPTLAVPGSKQSNLLASINGRLTAARINRWLQSHGWSSYSCWCRVPHSRFALQSLHPAKTVYDITDDYELYESSPHCRRLVRQREQQLLSRADLVLVTARELQNKDSLQQAHPRWIPNGVEYGLFAQAAESGEIHPTSVAMRKPLICHVGLTSTWMDFELLKLMGHRWPNQILMLGPIAAQVNDRARSIPGITWGGFVPQPELPAYLRGVDLFVMPHLVNELRNKSNPLKICEYLATGKPFVSVDLPALNPVRHLVDIAANHQEFIQLIEQRLQSPLPDRNQAGQDYARTQSWDVIFNHLTQQLAPLVA